MIAAVIEGHRGVEHLKTVRYSVLRGLTDAFLDRRNVFLRDRAAFDRVDEHHPLIIVRLDLQIDMPILAPSARLTDVLAFGLSRAGDRFPIRHLRSARADRHFELTHQAVDNDLQV